MDSIKSIENTSKRVERILCEDARARNDYKWLLYKVYQEIAHENGSNIFIPFDLFKELPSPETVSRVARHLQNDLQKYIPSQDTGLLRNKAQEEYKGYFGSRTK